MQLQDYMWFENHIADFYRQYGPKFLAIKDKTVLGVYDTFGEGVHSTSESEEPGSFIVQQCYPSKEDAVLQIHGNVELIPAAGEQYAG